MSSNAIFFAWNRAIPGRERISAEHFQEFVSYLTGLQQKNTIESFQPVFLDPHGGDLNGFFLISGESGNLDAIIASPEWNRHVTRAMMHLEGGGVVRGRVGAAVQERMKLWTELIPE